MIQQNVDRSTIFNRSWAEYKVGFNDSRGNYWLGNDLLSQLTLTGRYKARFDLQSRSNTSNWYSAEYNTFIVQPESDSDNYRLEVSRYSGNAGQDSLSHQNGMQFTTFDRDNDHLPLNCALSYGGGWWYKRCYACCMTCYDKLQRGDLQGFGWSDLPGGWQLQSSRMWLQCK